MRKTAGEAEDRNSTRVDLLVTVRGGGLRLERDHQEGGQGFRDDKVFHRVRGFCDGLGPRVID